MPLILYVLTALALLCLAHRFVRPLSRWAAILLFVFPFALTGYALFANRVMAPVDLPYDFVPMNWMKADYGIERGSTGVHTDVHLEFVPWRKATQWSLVRGEWGLWNPFTYGGELLLGGQQAAVTWPITWIACLLPAASSFTYTAAITLFLAALTAFLFARELGCREGAALVAAAGWSFTSSNVLFVLVSMSAVWSWAPLMFLGVRRVVRGRDLRGFAILTFAFTALLAAGHPESAAWAVMIGAFYGLFEIAQNRSAWLRAISLAVLAGVIALLLSAIHLLPFFEGMPLTQEHVHRQTIFRFEPRGVSAEHVAARMATTFFPYLLDRRWKIATTAPPSYTSAAVGSILIGLAIYALWRLRSRETWFFGGVAALCIVAGAEWKPLATALARLPLFDIALLDRLATAGALAISILAALGVEEICRRGGDRAAGWTLALWLAVVAAGNWFLVRTPLLDHGDVFFGRFVVAAEIALLMVAAVMLMQRRAIVPMLLAAIVAQRALSTGDMQKTFTRRQAYPPIPILEPLKNDHAPFRIVGHGLAFPPANSTMYELEDIRGYSAMTNLRFRETFMLWAVEQSVWFSRVDDLTRPFLSFLNVRYAITWDRDPPPDGWREVARMRGSILIENMRVLERAFLPRHVRVGHAPNVALTQMALTTDFRERAWIEAPVAAPYERVNGPGALTIRKARLGFEIDADMRGDGWIVTSITAWPGWRAYVGGRRVATQIANHAFVSVHVPAGKHRVRLKYWPESFVRGSLITAATLLAVILFAFLRHRRQTLLQRRDASLAPLSLGE